MEISLGTRTADTVRTYFEKARNPVIKAMLPQKAATVEEALKDYEDTLLPDAASYGRTILADGIYVGDIWCYCIDPDEDPNAMLSFCVFDESVWNKGIATTAARLFLHEAFLLIVCFRNKPALVNKDLTVGMLLKCCSLANIRDVF